MSIFEIIFWVCAIEAFIGHLPWWVPLIAFVICIITSHLRQTDKQIENKKIEELLKKIKDRERND